MPVGMHRPKPSKWKNVWPFLAILVIVPALGWAAATALSRQQTTTVNPTPAPITTTSGATPAPSAAPSSAAPAQSGTEATPSPSPSSSAASSAPDHGAVI